MIHTGQLRKFKVNNYHILLFWPHCERTQGTENGFNSTISHLKGTNGSMNSKN